MANNLILSVLGTPQVLGYLEVLDKLQRAVSMDEKNVSVRFYGLGNGCSVWMDYETIYNENGMENFLLSYCELDESTVATIIEAGWVVIEADADSVFNSCFQATGGALDVFVVYMADAVCSLRDDVPDDVIVVAIKNNINLFDLDDTYVGEYSCFQDYVQAYVEDCMDVPDHLLDYIDVDRVGRDLNDVIYCDGYVFRTC